MNSLSRSCWSSWCCRIWMRALTLEPEYWLLITGLMTAKLARSSSVTIIGPSKGGNRMKGIQSALMEFACCRNTFEGKTAHLFGVRLFPPPWLQIHHRHHLHYSSCLAGSSGCFCRTGPKVWSQFLSWGSQGGGVRPDHTLR